MRRDCVGVSALHRDHARPSRPAIKRTEVSELKCPKCGGRMEEGYVPDYAYGMVLRPSWFPGAPEISRWYGLKTKGRPSFPILTFSCVGCGYLESYARSDTTTPP